MDYRFNFMEFKEPDGCIFRLEYDNMQYRFLIRTDSGSICVFANFSSLEEVRNFAGLFIDGFKHDGAEIINEGFYTKEEEPSIQNLYDNAEKDKSICKFGGFLTTKDEIENEIALIIEGLQELLGKSKDGI
jgi:hypothetical protein